VFPENGFRQLRPPGHPINFELAGNVDFTGTTVMVDPTTIQLGPALAPQQGTRKVLTKPQ